MTTLTIDTQAQFDLDQIISKLRPGQVFSYFNLLFFYPRDDGKYIFDNFTFGDLFDFDQKYLLDITSGEVPDVRHIGYDRDGQNIFEKTGETAGTNVI